MKKVPVLLFLIFVCGCSPQKTLAHRLRGADRVVVTNTYEGLSISVTGEEVNMIVHAIAASRKESPLIKAAVGYTLEFYKGTEHLATVVTSYQVFWVEHNPYSDTTETLKAIYEKFRYEIFLKENPPKAP